MALIVAVLVGSLFLWMACAGFVYLASPGVRARLEQSGVSIPNAVPNTDPNDWWTSRVLSQVYTVALDAVASDEAVTGRLGEPIETDLNAEDLYRRQGAGALDTRRETIKFDIRGPQGGGVVTVVSSGGNGGPLRIEAITVTLEDESTIEVAPPPDQDFAPR